MFVCLCKKEFSQRQNLYAHQLICDTYMAVNHVCACGKTCINAQELSKHQETCKQNVTVPQQLECQLTQLINNNPISVIPNEHYGLLISKIKEKFNDDEQHQFIQSFYGYLKYNQRTDFIINLDDVWEWLGFTRFDSAKRVIDKHFELNKDYLILTPQTCGARNGHGGNNKEIIMMSIYTFKRVCMKAGTSKSSSIHEYYIKLEEVLQETLHEALTSMHKQIETTSQTTREKTILEQFPENVQCVYYGSIDNLSNTGEKLIKFGNSNNLKERVEVHKKTYSNFKLINAFKVRNKLQIENAIKNNKEFNDRRRDLVINNQNRVELLAVDNITYDYIDKLIKTIISCSECTPANFKKLLDENNVISNKLLLSQEEVARLRVENVKVLRRYNALLRRAKMKDEEVELLVNEYDTGLTPEPIVETAPTNVFINNNPDSDNEREDKPKTIVIIKKKPFRAKDGYYHIDGVKYNECIGTREEVMSGIAYKTSGGLTKNKLLVNKEGKIVSAVKFLQEKAYNRFEVFGVNKK